MMSAILGENRVPRVLCLLVTSKGILWETVISVLDVELKRCFRFLHITWEILEVFTYDCLT